MAPLLSSVKLASLLGVSRQTVFNLATGGAIPSYKVGKSFKSDLGEVLSALKNRKRKSAGTA